MKPYYTLCILVAILASTASGHQGFVENRGQWNAKARFYAPMNGLDAWVTDDGITYDVFALTPSLSKDPLGRKPLTNNQHLKFDTDALLSHGRGNAPQGIPSRSGHVVRMRFEGSHGFATAFSADQQKGHYNYISGSDSTKWVTNVPLYDRARIDHLYNGIDALLMFQDNVLRYDLVVAPGADASQVRMKFEGATSIRVTKAGELEIVTSLGTIRQRGLRAFQTLKNGKQQNVKCRFQVIDSITVRFVVGDYDKRVALTIDPLVYSTYVGGSGYCAMLSTAVDKKGCQHAVGWFMGAVFPTTAGAYQNAGIANELNVVIMKLAADGKTLVYATYLTGGYSQYSNFTTMAIEVGDDDNAVVAGTTSIVNFPTTTGAVQRTLRGTADAFITKLNATGSGLVYSTFVGGDGNDNGTSLAIDALGNVYLTGVSMQDAAPNTFPTTVGAYMRTPIAYPAADAFVVKLNSTCTAILFGTFIGGSQGELGIAITVDRSGNSYVTGTTSSTDLPTTPGAYGTAFFTNQSTSFIAKLNAAGSALGYLSYIGSPTESTDVSSISVDSLGQAVIVGTTNSPDYPTTPGALKTTHVGIPQDMYVTKFNDKGTALIYSTYIGGDAYYDAGFDVASDAAGNAYVVGYSYSTDFPTTADAFDRTLGLTGSGLPDAVIAILKPTGNSLLYSSYLGGAEQEGARAVALDHLGGVYIAGQTNSTDFPTTIGAFQRNLGTPVPPETSVNFFLTKFDICTVTLPQAKDTAICKGASTSIGGMQASGGVPPYRYEWSPTTGLNNSNIYNPIATPASTTSYRLTMTDGLGCVVRDTVVVTVWDGPTASAGPDSTLCANASVTIGREAIGVYPPFGYTWTPSTGLSATNAATPTAHPLVDTRYIVRVIDAKGCVDFDTVDIKVNPPVYVDAGLDVDICSGGSANLSGIASGGLAPFRYRWTPSSGLSRTDTATPVARPSITTRYYLTITDAVGCTAIDSVLVTVGAGVRTAIGVTGKVPMCSGDSVVLDAGAGGFTNYKWSSKQTTRTIVVKTAGRYWATFEGPGGCPGKTDSVDIVVVQLPDVRIRGAVTVCSNSTLSYSVPVAVGGSYTWSMSGTTGAITSRTDSNVVDIAWGQPGTATISVLVRNAEGCADSSTLMVTVGTGLKPVINTNRSTALCSGQSVVLDAGSGFSSYHWNTGDTTSTIIVNAAGKYAVQVFDGTGCSGVSDSIEVTSKTAPTPSISASNGTELCADSITTLTATPGYATYLWTSGETTESIDVHVAGTYLVTVMDADSCIGTASITISTFAAPSPKILPAGEISICEGDSVTIDASQGYVSYAWSTTAATPSIVAKTAGVYWVEVVDSNGCKGLSDSVTVIVKPITVQPTITVIGDTLVSSPSDTYQWIRDEADIAGATEQRYVTSQTGRYAVRVSSVGSCPSTSEPTAIGVQRVVWLDTVSGRVGDRLRLAMHIEPGLSLEDSAVGYNVYLHVQPTALFPHEVLDAVLINAGLPTSGATSMIYVPDGSISISRTTDHPGVVDTLILFLDVEGLVTAAPLNPVVVDSVILRTNNPSIGVTKLAIAGDGLVILSGCEINRTFGTRARILSIQPNPADISTVVRYKLTAGSQAILRLVDVQGQVVRSMSVSGTDTEQILEYSIDDLAAGVYSLQICDLHEVDALPLIITK